MAAHRAAILGDLHVLRFLIAQQQVDVNSTTRTGASTLHLACRHDTGILKYLIEVAKADVAHLDNAGNSVLHLAVEHGRLDNVKYLVRECKADIQATNLFYETVLHRAAAFGPIELVRWLVNKSAVDVNARDLHRRTALHRSIVENANNPDVAKFLLSLKNVNINLRDKVGFFSSFSCRALTVERVLSNVVSCQPLIFPLMLGFFCPGRQHCPAPCR